MCGEGGGCSKKGGGRCTKVLDVEKERGERPMVMGRHSGEVTVTRPGHVHLCVKCDA